MATQNVFSSDDNSQPLFFSEDAQSVEVAEPKPDDIGEISYTAAQIGESTPIVEVELTEKAHSEYLEERQENALAFTPEELPALEIGSRDSNPIKVFKFCFSEMISRNHVSRVRSCLVICSQTGKISRPTSAPVPADFAADVMLAGKKSLSVACYRVLCAMVATEFERFHELSSDLRMHIMKETGKELLRRKVFVGQSTKQYWTSSYRARAPKTAAVLPEPVEITAVPQAAQERCTHKKEIYQRMCSACFNTLSG